jgi:hypothetical protein
VQVKSRLSVKDLLDQIVKIKGAKPLAPSGVAGPVIMIDNLHTLKISDVDVIIALLENFTILGATEDTTAKLKQIWWKFRQMEVDTLSERSSKELIKYLTQNLSISDYEMLETRILTLSDRLPLAIVDMVGQISHGPVVTRDVIREVYHEAGIQYRDWTSFMIALWGIAISFRFIVLGTRSYEGYVLAAIGTALLALMRIFVFKMR